MNRVMQVDAGQHCKDVGLQNRDDQLQESDQDAEDERQNAGRLHKERPGGMKQQVRATGGEEIGEKPPSHARKVALRQHTLTT